jgi:hypothetical protein
VRFTKVSEAVAGEPIPWFRNSRSRLWSTALLGFGVDPE